MPALDHGKMAKVVYSHEVLRGSHCIIRSAGHYPCRHDVARTHILQFTQICSRKDPHKIAFRDNADHVTSSFTDGHCANAMCVKELGDTCQRIVRPARHDPLARMLEKLTNLHGVPPYTLFIL